MKQDPQKPGTLLREVVSRLPRRIERSLGGVVQRVPGTDRMPRYRMQKNKNFQDSLVGTTVKDRYYVLSALGTGGMSVVYLAKSMRRKPKLLALKTLRTQGLNDEVVVKRFQREAELLSGLNHPRIVQVHDYGYTKRGQPYFVMDYLTGENLGQVINREGPLSPSRVRNIFMQVCGAVDHAHRCGVVHRDLKPGNIMLLDLDGETDFVKVVDFGIARFQTEAHRLTRLGEVWGSPVYMSPEQCMGKPLDVRSDVYSVGIAMYESLTGDVPFLGKNYVDTMGQQINDPPKAFKEMAPNLTIPENLEQVVVKSLAKDPLERYQSMGELREAINDAFARMPASLRSSRNRVAAAQPLSQAKVLSSASSGLSTRNLIIAVICVLAVIVFVFGMIAGQLLSRSHQNSTTDSVEPDMPRPGVKLAPPVAAPENVP